MSHRVDQVSSLIQKNVSEIIARGIELPVGSFVTVQNVVIGPDLKHAIIRVLVLPADKTKEVLSVLIRERVFIQRELIKRIATKFSPTLEFQEDAGEAHARHIDTLLENNQ